MKTKIAKTKHNASPHQRFNPTNPSQARQINALPSREINSLSPRVVSKRSIPTRGAPPGLRYSHSNMTAMKLAMVIKKIAVGCVQPIQDKFIAQAFVILQLLRKFRCEYNA
jgi:hypothetical protein